MTSNSPESVEAFRQWIPTAQLSQSNRMGSNAVLRAMPDAMTLDDLEDGRVICDAMIAAGVKPITAGMYLSRFRSTVRRFRGTYKPPVKRQPEGPAPLTPERQLADALACLERWPTLAPYLRGGLAAAAADILGVSREVVSLSGQP